MRHLHLLGHILHALARGEPSAFQVGGEDAVGFVSLIALFVGQCFKFFQLQYPSLQRSHHVVDIVREFTQFVNEMDAERLKISEIVAEVCRKRGKPYGFCPECSGILLCVYLKPVPCRPMPVLECCCGWFGFVSEVPVKSDSEEVGLAA